MPIEFISADYLKDILVLFEFLWHAFERYPSPADLTDRIFVSHITSLEMNDNADHMRVLDVYHELSRPVGLLLSPALAAY